MSARVSARPRTGMWTRSGSGSGSGCGEVPDRAAVARRGLTAPPGLAVASRCAVAQRAAVATGLQATAGNAAVCRHLPVVQRYDAFEHATEGDRVGGSRVATVGERQDDYTFRRTGGLQLTSGEINALADLYGSPEQLYRADPAEISRVVALVRRQQRDRNSVTETEWDEATGGRYNQLNLRNSPHFAPSNPALIPVVPGTSHGGDNVDQFMRYYNETIVNGQEAYHFLGLPSAEQTRQKLDQATVSAGFAEHFIMDAFSAGHLFDKDDFLAQAQHTIEALPANQLSGLFQTVAHRVLANPRANALLAQYEPHDRPAGGWMPWRPNFDHEYAFKGLLEQMYADPEGRQAVYNSLVKVVHDRLSTRDAGGGLVGVPVENSAGSWVLSGDRTLDTSPDTQKMIDRAITQFRDNMAPYLAGPVPADAAHGGYCPGADKVTALFPRPTADSTKMIAELVRRVTDPNVGMIDALVEVLVGQLQSILDALEKRHRIRKA